MLGSIQPLLK